MRIDDNMHHEEHDPHDFAHASAFDHKHARADCPGQVRCPKCHALHVEQRHLAQRIGSAIGTIAGAVGGACRALGGYELGLAVGAIALGPPGAMLGAVSGAVVSALMGGATGWAIGIKLGSAIDTTILKDYRCLACTHTFSAPSPK